MATNKVRARKYVVTIWRWNNGANDIWYWQLNGSNGRVLAACPASGYDSKRNAENGVARAAKAMGRGFYTTRVIANNDTEKKAA